MKRVLQAPRLRRIQAWSVVLNNGCGCTYLCSGVIVIDEVPHPCDGQVSKRTWERQAMLCREKLRFAKEGQDGDVEASVPLLDLQAGRQGNSHDKHGGASSDDDAEGGEPAEPRFVIDDEGQITFQDIIKDSLEEEVHAFKAEVERNNIRKIHDAYCCPFSELLADCCSYRTTWGAIMLPPSNFSRERLSAGFFQ